MGGPTKKEKVSGAPPQGLRCEDVSHSNSIHIITPPMKKKSASRSAFFNLRILIVLCIALAGVSLALVGIGALSATAAPVKIKNHIITASNDSRGRNATPINTSGASVSTDGGATFTRLTLGSGQGPFSNTEGDPVVLYHKPTGTWFTVWLDVACGGQGLGGYKSTTPENAASWTHFTCIHSTSQDDRESGWSDNNPASPNYGRMYVSWNDFAINSGALFVTYSTDAGATWHAPIQVANGIPFI